jgi:CRP-like cAMP-binding protein
MSLAAIREADLISERLLSAQMSFRPQTVFVPKQCNLYMSGDKDGMIYWIHSGHVKLIVNTSRGKECLLDIYAAGDFFGESSLLSAEARLETATAMDASVVKKLPCELFLAGLNLPESRSFITQLGGRLLEQRRFITDLTTLNCECRLGKVLLRLGSRLGRPHSEGRIIDLRISQEELSHLVGTTRPRVTEFMNKFRKLGMVNLGVGQRIIVNEPRLLSYLASTA